MKNSKVSNLLNISSLNSSSLNNLFKLGFTCMYFYNIIYRIVTTNLLTLGYDLIVANR